MSFISRQKNAGLSAMEELAVLKGENYKGSNAMNAVICTVSNTMAAGDFDITCLQKASPSAIRYIIKNQW
jgi:hypothetical protein